MGFGSDSGRLNSKTATTPGPTLVVVTLRFPRYSTMVLGINRSCLPSPRTLCPALLSKSGRPESGPHSNLIRLASGSEMMRPPSCITKAFNFHHSSRCRWLSVGVFGRNWLPPGRAILISTNPEGSKMFQHLGRNGTLRNLIYLAKGINQQGIVRIRVPQVRNEFFPELWVYLNRCRHWPLSRLGKRGSHCAGG